MPRTIKPLPGFKEEQKEDFYPPTMEEMIESIPDKKLIISEPDLRAALYFIQDAAERGQLDLFLTGETAKQVFSEQKLSGDKITVGVRRNEWVSGQGRIAQMFLEHELNGPVKVSDKGILYEYQGVPVEITIYEEDDCLKSFNRVFYEYEMFNLPNPLHVFLSKYKDE